MAALLMLGCSVIAVPAQAGWFDFDSTPAAKTDIKADAKNAAAQPATTLDDSIRQAQMLRLAGSYPEAIKHLSQLMLVAGDDSRVISEYGKTLAAMGRASDAVNFLTRAQQLQPNDWTVYSALGVAYDQIGDQKSAQINYGQALKLNPEEPSILSNYALSRMLAKDPEMARGLAARAEKAGGSRDAMIARNIAMIRSIAPEAPVQQVAQAPAPAPVPQAAPRAPVAVASVPATPVAPSENRVVMQKVPVDPLAGPVQTAAKPSSGTATSAPRPLQAKPMETPVTPAPVKAAEPAPIAPAPVATAKVTPPAPAKTAEVKPALVKPAEAAPLVAAKVTPPAPVKTVAVKAVPVKFSQPAPLTAAKLALAPIKIAEPAVTPPAPVKAAEAKPVAAAPTSKVAMPAPVKAADVQKPAATSVTVKMAAPVPVKAAEAAKPEAAPKVLVSAPIKAADAKPLVKTVGQPKDAIPGLRMSANAY
ncbi:MAG TPA: tetratricopeptide repeat protein [Rhizomicrobium sp.]|nr:tetratricopeptide repeat protein [Rhizomicrobium sp.]